ncbi:MAG: YwqH-like family protein [Fastidiosipilaceae bacterium]|jgi:chromosome segregation ATPase|nr:DUF5082 domain-containing protein [Clostridiaceae bacterium]
MSATWSEYYAAVDRCYAQQNHNSNMRSQISQCQNQITKLEEKIRRLNRAKSNAISDNSAFSSDMNAKIKSIDAGRFTGERKDKVQTAMDQVKSAVADYTGSTFDRSVVTPIDNKVQELRNEISNLNSQISSCRSRIVRINWPSIPVEN